MATLFYPMALSTELCATWEQVYGSYGAVANRSESRMCAITALAGSKLICEPDNGERKSRRRRGDSNKTNTRHRAGQAMCVFPDS